MQKKTVIRPMMIDLQQCAALLRQAESALLLCHSHPDGDTLGSGAALARALLAMGKRVALLCDDSIAPCYNSILEGIPMAADFEPALTVAVDVADTKLLGTDCEKAYGSRIDLCIDHHGSNKQFAKKLWLCPDSASTAEMMYLLLQQMEAPITPAIANCLFTGVSTDTGCFRFSNTTPRTHRIAAELMELGADSRSIIQVFFETKSREYAALERLALDKLALYLDGRCAIMPVTRAMYAESGAGDNDTNRLSDLPRQIEGVKVGITLKEQENGCFKASVRTHGDVDASAICARLGGGGHKGAAGCAFDCSLEQAVDALLNETARELSAL